MNKAPKGKEHSKEFCGDILPVLPSGIQRE